MRVLRIKCSYFLCNEEDPDKMILLTFASANLVDASTELQNNVLWWTFAQDHNLLGDL